MAAYGNNTEEALERKAREIERGRKAGEVFDNPIFSQAIEGVRADLMDIWLKSKPEETLQRERMHMAVYLLDEIAGTIRIWAESGKVTEKHLERTLRTKQ